MRIEHCIRENRKLGETQSIIKLIRKLESIFVGKCNIFILDLYGIAKGRIEIRDSTWTMLDFEDFVSNQNEANSWTVEELICIIDQLNDVQELKIRFLGIYENTEYLIDSNQVQIDFELNDSTMLAIETENVELLYLMKDWLHKST